jgi:cobalamin biosynthesis protein CobC
MSSISRAARVSAAAMASQPSDAKAAPVEHGGDLGAARLLFPGAPEPFIDLSTGINPYPYPIPPLLPAAFARLPERTSADRLAAVAAAAYGAPSAANVVSAPGTQILLPLVAGLVRPGRAAVLGPTYLEHVRAARQVGHDVEEVCDFASLRGADFAVVVNPNNPDGRIVPRQALLDCAQNLRPGGLLAVDEAFMDVVPPGASVVGDVGLGNIVVLRSFGKFYGLAGLRLGFALAAPDIATQLRESLGPWAVGGPALAVGAAALQDRPWAEAARARLVQGTARLDRLLAGAGLEVIGGTPLFRLVHTPGAQALFQQLGSAGLFVRRFAQRSTWLRFGLPADEPSWQRLAAALGARFDPFGQR